MKRSTKIALAALAACAALQLAVGSPPRAVAGHAAPFVHLPRRLGATESERVALSPVERRLAAAPHVAIERRSYGPTQVSLVTVDGGIKEHHPPTVCLEASGYEVVSREERQSPAGCTVELRVRRTEGADQRLHLFAYTYLSDRQQQVTCSLWRRIGDAVRARLAGGRPARWATVQVLDRDARRARSTLATLIASNRRSP